MVRFNVAPGADRQANSVEGDLGPMTEREAANSGRTVWRWLAIALLLVVAGAPHWRELPFGVPLEGPVDIDGVAKLRGIERDPSVGALLGYFVGDDPQRVHTFRPLPAATLWVEYHLWGFNRGPYLLVNAAWLLATALALVWLGRVIGMPWTPAVGAGIWMLAYVRDPSRVVAELVATRHDLLCVFFSILAVGMLIRYLEEGRARDLAAHAGLALLAYLSKEMAVALVPVAVLLVLAKRRDAPLRRLLHAVGAAVAVAGVWYVWYLVAQSNMGPAGYGSHSVVGMGMLLQKRWPTSLVMMARSLLPPIYGIIHVLRSDPGWALLWYGHWWREVIEMVIWLLGLWLLWVGRRWWLAVIYAWKFSTYLPVLPLSDAWPWYRYMPHVLDPLILTGAIWVAWHRWDIHGRAWTAAGKLRDRLHDVLERHEEAEVEHEDQSPARG